MFAAVDASNSVHCSASSTGDAATVRFESRDGVCITVDSDLIALVRNSGIDMRAENTGLTIGFPR
jgi:RNA:NAD 2'-phosphotransferase (TPT1/KptA family)